MGCVAQCVHQGKEFRVVGVRILPCVHVCHIHVLEVECVDDGLERDVAIFAKEAELTMGDFSSRIGDHHKGLATDLECARGRLEVTEVGGVVGLCYGIEDDKPVVQVFLGHHGHGAVATFVGDSLCFVTFFFLVAKEDGFVEGGLDGDVGHEGSSLFVGRCLHRTSFQDQVLVFFVCVLCFSYNETCSDFCVEGDVEMSVVSFPVYLVSGRGLAAAEISSLEESDEIVHALGVAPFPGSLNLISRFPVRLKEDVAVFTSRRIFQRALLNGIPVVVARWPTCPLHVFEVLHPERLRDRLGPESESECVLTLLSEEWQVPSFKERLFWHFVWWRREHWFYQHDRYNTPGVLWSTQNPTRTPHNERRGETFAASPFEGDVSIWS